MNRQPEIFISYSSQDKAVASAVQQTLENASLECWIASRDITPGRKYAEAILDGIDQCKVFLLVLSASSNASPQVEMEVNRAASKNKIILSFRLDQGSLSKSLEYYLSSRHWLEAANPPGEADFNALISAVQRLLAAAVTEPELPPTDKGQQLAAVEPHAPKRQKVAAPDSLSVPSNPFTLATRSTTRIGSSAAERKSARSSTGCSRARTRALPLWESGGLVKHPYLITLPIPKFRLASDWIRTGFAWYTWISKG